MDYLPLHFNLKTRSCLLVGGGEIALRKADLLIQAGAHITVVALEVCEPLKALLASAPHNVQVKAYTASDVLGKVLVVSATNNSSVNQQVADDANAIGIPVNVVDKPELCSVIFPAIVDRSP